MKKFGTWLGVLIVAWLVVYAFGWFDVAEDTVDVDVIIEDTMDDDTEEVVAEGEDNEIEDMDENDTEEDDSQEMASVDLENSTVLWEGRANGKSHKWDIQLLEASLEMDDEELVGGSFVIDMDTIRSIEDDWSTIDNLNNHLKADDFFDVENYPTSRLVITEVTTDTIEADLTIKWETHPVSLNRTASDDGLSATFSIDSTKWGVQEWWSLIDQAKNAMVADDIDFVIDLQLS